MLTEKQEKLLKNKIKKIIRETIEENNFFETKDNNKFDSGENSQTRQEIEKWVDSALQKDSTLAYELWPDKDEDSARSLFAKKANGRDANGNKYEFTDPEIVKLANIKDDYIEEFD